MSKTEPHLRPGYRTTEFWLTVVSMVLVGVGLYLNKIPVDVALPVIVGGASMYSIARGIAK